MLKKRIVCAAIVLGLSLPSLVSATPLSWEPGPDLLASITRLWDLLHGAQHHGAAAPAARDHRKNGPGMDPTGSPTPPPSGAQTTAPSNPMVTGQ